VIAEPRLIEKLWPQVWPEIEASVTQFGVETEEELKSRLLATEAFMIIVGDGVAIVRNCGRFFEINYIGGKNIKQWWPKMSEHIDAMAKAFGCEKILSFGRPAWKRIATDYEDTKNKMYVKEVA